MQSPETYEMKNSRPIVNMLKKSLCWLAALVMLLPVSCVDDNLSEPLNDQVIKEIPTLDEQLASVEASVEDVKALQAELEQYDMTLADAAKALDGHVALLKKGVSVEKGTLAALDLQKSLAACIGTVQAELMINDRMDEKIGSRLAELESGVKAWLGEPFGFYYPVAVAQVKVNAVVAGFDATIDNQLLYVDALLSDIEAGLRKDEKPEELTSLAASVKKNDTEAKTLSSELSSLSSEMETGYRTALTAAVSNPSEFDAEALKTLNATAEVEDVDNSLQGLIIRVQECETTLQNIIERLGALEENIEGLLGMIQSVTFMSPTSSDKVSAHYSLDPSELTGEGYMNRLPSESIQLSYVVRPAAASAALTDQNIWNDGLKVLGYYAGRIEQAAVSNQNLIGFEISAVEADQLSGVVTVTVANTLSEDFYFKRTGAKMALSVTTGKNDLTSKFVEVVPVDESGIVYVESLSLSTDYVEVDDGKTVQLRAMLGPDDATDATLIWTTSDNKILTVSGNGVLTAIAVGEAVVTVKTKSTDEWGRVLSRTCRVKVLPNIRLVGPASVNKGGTISVRVESPEYIDPQYITWSVDSKYNSYVSVTKDADGTGKITSWDKYFDNGEYQPIDITCKIGDYNPLYLTHTVRAVAVQPTGIVISFLADNENEKTIKIGQGFSLGGSIVPANVSSEEFKLAYQAYGAGNPDVATIVFDNGWVTAKGPGSATFMARVLPSGSVNFYYPSGSEIIRYMTLHVEPYWVKTMSLPETYEMTLEQTASFTPEFTSDVDGVQPTYTDVVWTSSHPEYVTVDEKTGEIKPVAVGSSTITATTSNVWSVPDGSAQKTAECVVIVKKDENPVAVGDYYYSDGTWGKDASRNDIIGVVFSTASSTEDNKLRSDFPTCTRGLVVSTEEYTRNHGYLSNQLTAEWLKSYGWRDNIQNEDKSYGYSNTVAMTAYAAANYSYEPSGTKYGELFHSTEGVVAKHTKAVAAPVTASCWFVPSFKELKILSEGLSTVNASLSRASKTQISGKYWLSSFGILNIYSDLKISPYDMAKEGWSTDNEGYSKDCNVRVVLAF